jgi:hypothetical protein
MTKVRLPTLGCQQLPRLPVELPAIVTVCWFVQLVWAVVWKAGGAVLSQIILAPPEGVSLGC